MTITIHIKIFITIIAYKSYLQYTIFCHYFLTTIYMTSYFQDFWLSSKDEKIYLACLTLGSSPASIVAKRVGLKRSTTYLILENLVKKWFISKSSKNGVIQFNAVSPDDLTEIFLQKNRQMSHKIQFFRENIPELRALESKIGTRPKIRLFTGKEAIKKIYSSLLEASTWSSYFDISALEKEKDTEMQKLVWDIGRKIHEYKKSPRDIFVDCPLSQKYKKEMDIDHYTVRICSKQTWGDSIFFEDHFFLISYDDGMQLLEVHNYTMAQIQLAMFDGLWKSLEK